MQLIGQRYPLQSRQNKVVLNDLTAQIKSLDDLNAYMRNTPKEKNPIEKLSSNGKARFLSSLRFNEKGVTSFGYMDMVSELSASEIYQILSLFGMQEYMPTTNFNEETSCESRYYKFIRFTCTSSDLI